MSAPIFLFLAATLIACGCAADTRPAATAPATAPTTSPSTQPVTHTGTLRGGMMAIGGETTGWTLAGDGAVGGIELDVSRVQDEAKRLEGKRVTVTGRMFDKKYVERGTVRMMRVERISEAK